MDNDQPAAAHASALFGPIQQRPDGTLYRTCSSTGANEPNESRSELRRTAIQRGEPQPQFIEPSAGEKEGGLNDLQAQAQQVPPDTATPHAAGPTEAIPGPTDFPSPQAAGPNVVCHAPGDRCLGCDHYYGKAAECKYKDVAGSTPRTDAFSSALYNESCSAAAGMGGRDLSPEEG